MTNQALIFFDIDGTLLDHDKNLPSTTKSAINQLQSDGHIIAIATGRGSFMYEGLRQELNIDTFVSFNGSYVVLEDKVIYTHPLNKQKLLELTQEGLVNDQPSVYMSENELRSKDRKSTRLNSSHVAISYAVFCLEKKINKTDVTEDTCYV